LDNKVFDIIDAECNHEVQFSDQFENVFSKNKTKLSKNKTT